MSEPRCAQKGPYVKKEAAGQKWWCACGRSRTQPYCDGSHAGTGISPVLVQISEAKTIAWCGCKKSAKAPYCDGTHAKL